MAQSKILLDTNSYLRLARSIHPLLQTEFGRQKFCCYVLQQVDQELGRSSRLQSLFAWAMEDEFSENRQRRLSISRKEGAAIANAAEYIWEHVQAGQRGLSRTDVLCVAHGLVLGVPIISDDEPMLRVADTFQVNAMKSLDLLKLMLECEHINMNKVREVVGYWTFARDAPSGVRPHYRRLFGEDLP